MKGALPFYLHGGVNCDRTTGLQHDGGVEWIVNRLLVLHRDNVRCPKHERLGS